MLPKEAIEEFIAIHKKHTGVELPYQEALTVAQNFFDTVCMLWEHKSTIASDNKEVLNGTN